MIFQQRRYKKNKKIIIRQFSQSESINKWPPKTSTLIRIKITHLRALLAEKETDSRVIKTGSAKRAWFYFTTDIKIPHKLLQMVQRPALFIFASR